MPLEFQDRGGDYRVVKIVNGAEHMLACLETKAWVGPSQWMPLPREECTIRSAIGPLSIPDLEEMIARVNVDARAHAEELLRLAKEQQAKAEATLAAIPQS